MQFRPSQIVLLVLLLSGSVQPPILACTCVVRNHESICHALKRADRVFSGTVVGIEKAATPSGIRVQSIESTRPVGIGVSGVVTSAGTPIPSVEVDLDCLSSRRHLTSITDTTGRFRWSGLSEGECRIRTGMPGFDTLEGQIRLEAGADLSLELRLNIQAVDVSIQVDRTWKGPAQQTISVRTHSDGATCGYPFEVGNQYLVFASEQPDGYLWTDICGGTQPKEAARDYLDLLDDLANGVRPSLIHGWLADTGDPSFRAASGFSKDWFVIISGMGHEERVIPDADGYFRSRRLPEGTYEVRAGPDDHHFWNAKEMVTIGADTWCPEIRFELAPSSP